MMINPVRVSLTQAIIRLAVDQTPSATSKNFALAPSPTIDQDVLAIEDVKAQSELDSLVDFEA